MSRLPDLSPLKNCVTTAGSLLAFLLLPCAATTSQDSSILRPERGGVRLAGPPQPSHPPRPVAFSAPQIERLSIGLVTVSEDRFQTSRIRGASLAVALANRSRAASGPRFVLAASGVDGPWQTAAGVARDLLFERDCLALITPADGDTAHLMIQLAARFHVPVVSLSEASRLTRAAVPWLFRMVPDARQQIAELVGSAGLERGASLTTLLPAGRAGRALRSDLEVLARELSISFTPLITVDPTDPIDPIDPIDSERTDIECLTTGPLLLWLDPASTRRVLGQLERSRFQGQVLVPHGRLDDMFAMEQIPGVTLHTIRLFDTSSSGADAFREAFQIEYGEDPDEAAACAHDATRLLIQAITAAGPDRSSIRDWLAHSRHEPGLTGAIAFDRTGSRSAKGPKLNPSSPSKGTPREEGQSP